MVLTRIPDDIGSFEVEEPIYGSNNVVICVRLNLQGVVAPDKYGRNFPGMNHGTLLDLSPQTRCEVERGGDYLSRQWETIKRNLLAITDLVGSFHRIEPPWLRNKITRFGKQKHRDSMIFKVTFGYQDYPSCVAEKKRISRIQLPYQTAHNERVSGAANITPKPTTYVCRIRQLCKRQ